MQSVSVIKNKTIRTWLLITAFSVIFAFVYECFSFGVYSIFMMSMPLIPFALGVMPNLITSEDMGRIYNDGVLTLMCGFTLCGILEIYGTSNVLVQIYYMVGISLIIGEVITYVIQKVITK
jgi:hypothetical protein